MKHLLNIHTLPVPVLCECYLLIGIIPLFTHFLNYYRSDENTASVLQDHYLDSSWRTENGLIPWTLDSTISEENRAVIEKMLLEEEYPLMIMRKVKISG